MATFTELHEMFYSDRKAEFLYSVSRADIIAWECLAVLCSRKGFPHWWDAIGDDLRDEVFADMCAAIQTQLHDEHAT